MKIRDLTAVILRLYALQLFFDCVPALYRFPMHWNYKFAQDDVMRKYLLVDDAITVGLYTLVGILLLLYAGRVAEWVVGKEDEGTTQVDSSGLVRMALVIAGAVFFVHGAALLAYNCAYWHFLPSADVERFSRPELTLQQKARIVEAIVTILVGLVLFIGNGRLTEFASKVRTYGRSVPYANSKGEDHDR
jgi:hypothetical protein